MRTSIVCELPCNVMVFHKSTLVARGPDILTVGLRQGEHLSPLLFAIFLNDMETFFPSQKWNTQTFIEQLYNDSNDGINGMLNLFVLLYADDTVIMAENEYDMQSQRNLDLRPTG